jgi:type IV pilus assembly protein PilV
MRGVGLIEVLVALLVLSVGLLGIVGMQITAKKANYEAVQRTSASHLAQDLIARIRANPTGDYVDGSVLGDTALDPVNDEPDPNCYAGNSCTSGETVAMDLFQWTLAMQGQAETRDSTATGGLVSPRACLVGPDGVSGYYKLAIVWRGTDELEPLELGNQFCAGGLDGTDLYGSEGDPGDDSRRRVLLLEFYVTI